MKNNLVGLMVGIVCAIVIIGTILAPVIESSKNVPSVYYNVGSDFALVDSDGTDHTITISLGTENYLITTDGSEVTTPSMASYNPGGVEVASAIGIGLYEGSVNADSVLVSQSGLTPTASTTIDGFRTYALAGNTDNDYGTYQLWNFYQYTLNKMMAYVVIGDFDSQYMMGAGVSGGSGSATTGLTSSAFTQSSTTASQTNSESIFIENDYGSLWEFVGDTKTSDYVLIAGNTLGGQSFANIESVLDGSYAVPSTATNPDSTDSYSLIFTLDTSDASVWGAPDSYTLVSTITTGTDADSGVNDRLWAYSGDRVLFVGGSWVYGAGDGLSAWRCNDSSSANYTALGSRLAYVIPDTEDAVLPTGGDYVYKMITSTNDDDESIISDVLYYDATTSAWVSAMPSGTTLNSFWNFDTSTGVGAFNSYYALVNLYDGDNDDTNTADPLSTVKGEIAYILDPTDWTKTLAGDSYDATQYNAMLIVPTMYWGVGDDGALYMSNLSDISSYTSATVDMDCYAHTYTVDPDVDTGNPSAVPNASLVMGEDSILRLYYNGDVRVITSDSVYDLGTVEEDSTVSVTVNNDVMTYVLDGSSDESTIDGILAYISSSGDYVLCANPKVVEDSVVILGGYRINWDTTTEDVVSLGYCANGSVSELTSDNITSYLCPVSSASNTPVALPDGTEVTVTLSDYADNDLKQVDSIVFDTTWSDSGVSTATYTYFLAPKTIEYTGYIGDGLASMLDVTLVLTIIGVLMMVTYAVMRNRD